MSIEEQNRKSIEAARVLKDHCSKTPCKDCPFAYGLPPVATCILGGEFPFEWDLPEEEGDRQKMEWECEA